MPHSMPRVSSFRSLRTVLLAGLTALGVLASGALVGCQKPEPVQPTPPMMVDQIEMSRLGYSVQWVQNVGVPVQRNRIKHVRLLEDVAVVLEEPQNLLTVVSLDAGERRWAKVVGEQGDTLYRPVQFLDRVVINSSRQVFQFDLEDGSLRMIHALAHVVGNSPAVAGGLGVFGGSNGIVFGQSLRSGQVRWEYRMSGEILARPVVNRQNNFAFVTDINGSYKMFDGLNGELLWSDQAFEGIVAQPMFTSLSLIVPSEDRILYALGRVNGEERYRERFTVPLREDPMALARKVYQPVPDLGMVVIDDSRGERLWTTDIQRKPVVEVGGRLLMHDTNNLYVMNPKTGETLNTLRTEKLHSVLTTPENDLIFVSPSGKMVYFSYQRGGSL